MISSSSGGTGTGSGSGSGSSGIEKDGRYPLYCFLESKSRSGKMYEKCIIALISVNVVAYILSSLFVEEYNSAAWASRFNDGDNDDDGGDNTGLCNKWCDTLWFGNYDNNYLEFLDIGSTSVLTLFTVLLFTMEYLALFYVADLIDPKQYTGFTGRLRFVISFFSVVDLISIVPFYYDSFFLLDQDLHSTQFVRMFRLLRMMQVEGRYDTALTMVGDVYRQTKHILGTTLFVGVTTWVSVSSLYYIAERNNHAMIYCGKAPDYCHNEENEGQIDTSACTFDVWGLVDCTNAGCPPSLPDHPYPCYNLFESIPMASYYTLLNLFGEFPLLEQHNLYGKYVGTFVACVAIFVFALPTSIVGNGFETVIEQHHTKNKQKQEDNNNDHEEEEEEEEEEIKERTFVTENYIANNTTMRCKLYNILFGSKTTSQLIVAYTIDALTLIIFVTFTMGTFNYDSTNPSPSLHKSLDIITTMITIIFTIEYLLRIYCIVEDPIYAAGATDSQQQKQGEGRLYYFNSFFSVVDLVSFVPFWIYFLYYTMRRAQEEEDAFETTDTIAWNLVKSLQLLRILRLEKYTHAFRTFDDVIRMNIQILTVTIFSALLCWILFSSILYITERDNVDDEMANNYNTIPNSMWLTLLNLTGEAPLCQYSVIGKIITAILALFATGLFGIPIGVLGAGFQQIVEDENAEDQKEEAYIMEQLQKADAVRSMKNKIWSAQHANLIDEKQEQGKDDEEQKVTSRGRGTEIVQQLAMDQVEEAMNQIGDEQGVNTPQNSDDTSGATLFESKCYAFVNGMSSNLAITFEITIGVLILITVAIGILQTVDGYQNVFHQIEWIAVFIFTVEYILRVIGVPADPEFTSNLSSSPFRNADTGGDTDTPDVGEQQPLLSSTNKDNFGAIDGNTGNDSVPLTNTVTPATAFSKRLRFIVTFYSVIDLLAIVPMYVSYLAPEGFVDQYDEYFRMLRILRLVKYDKYVPSITLLDDVIRLKYQKLKVACYAASSLWIIFSALIFVFEHGDVYNDIDPVPLYDCGEDCTMADRFQNYLDSLYYIGVHLTGDYPIIEYSWPSRIIQFFMVIAAVGVVSIPSAIIADGFMEIMLRGGRIKNGDDWYDEKYKELKGTGPPKSKYGPTIDQMQIAVDNFLNGVETDIVTNTELGENKREFNTIFSKLSRVLIFTVIISNVVAVLVESVPSIDKVVGNNKGNFFDAFETFSVMLFALEYMLRLFCAPKNRKALYSTKVYALSFFGIVDFLSTAPWFVQQLFLSLEIISPQDDAAKIFRIFRVFRILQLEDFFTAFSLLDNVFRMAKDAVQATGLIALIIWVGCGALFYIFEENNPNWRQCDEAIPAYTSAANNTSYDIGCYDFASTADCTDYYGAGMCTQDIFTNMPNTLYYTAVFLGGEWGVIDFTWPGRMVCLFLCVVGIALYAIPVSVLFACFGYVLKLEGFEEM